MPPSKSPANCLQVLWKKFWGAMRSGEPALTVLLFTDLSLWCGEHPALIHGPVNVFTTFHNHH